MDPLKRLNKFTKEGSVDLDLDKYLLKVYYTIFKYPFFNRFEKEFLLKNLEGAQVEQFREKEMIFSKDRVGIVTHGSVLVRSHERSYLEPFRMCRLRPG